MTTAVPATAAETKLAVSAVHPVPISTMYLSPTVAMLKGKDRPQDENICIHCVAAIWFTVPKETRCFCQRFKTIVWLTHKPIPITRCDGFADHFPEKD